MIYSKIKEICNEKGLSVSYVEKEAKLSNGSISKWDKNKPLAESLNAVAKVLDIPIDVLLENKNL